MAGRHSYIPRFSVALPSRVFPDVASSSLVLFHLDSLISLSYCHESSRNISVCVLIKLSRAQDESLGLNQMEQDQTGQYPRLTVRREGMLTITPSARIEQVL